jgi:hypothetical protein
MNANEEVSTAREGAMVAEARPPAREPAKRSDGLALAFTHKYPWTKERELKSYNFVLSEPQIMLRAT